MNIPIKLGDEVLYPASEMLIRERDDRISVPGDARNEVIGKNILCNSLESRAELMSGASLTSVAELLGHSFEKITEKHYRD